MPVRDVRKHRDLHLERKHVYDVYDQIAPKFSEISQKAWPNVRRFLKDLPPGSIVADIGCGSGRYLHINSKVSKIGVDICTPLVESARKKGHEVLVADNLTLPFRDGVFDAVISIGVIHHFSSQSRRLQAVKEMCRLLRPGGQIMIYVWAFEQKHRKFKAQDVLIPWHGNQSNKRSGSLDLSSNASSDSESSIDTEDSRKSIQNFNRTVSDPGTEHDETQLQAYLRTVTQRSQFTQKHRCNTLPSSLEGLTGEEPHDETMPSVLAAECRKFEASLKAMSSSMFYLTENEQRQASEYGQDYIDRVEDSSFHKSCISHHMAAKIPVLDDSLPPLRNQRTAQVSASTTTKESSLTKHSRDLETNGYQNDKYKQGNASNNKTKNVCSTPEISPDLKDINASKSNFVCDLCPEHKPSLGQYLCINSDLDDKSYALTEDSVKGKKNKLTLFASIKESFLNFFEGKSSKMKKPKLEMPSCKSEEVDVSDFAVREFPMSSCPNYRKEIISEDSEEVFLSNEPLDTGVICMKDEASDFHGQQTHTKLSRPNGAQLKHSMSDISSSKLQSVKCFDHMSTDSLKTRTQVIGMSRQHSHSLPTVNQFTEPVQVSYPPASVPSSPAIKSEFFKNSTELSRFYHVFKDGELSKLISKQVPNVRIVSSTYDHANWCIVAEKCLTS